MKKVIAFFLILAFFLVGCGSLNETYVQADRANYDVIAPIVSSYINGTIVPPTSSDKDYLESRLVLWNARITSAEEALKAEKEKD